MPYHLLKGAFLDVSDYVHCGVDIEDIEETIYEILKIRKNAICKPVNGFLAYNVHTSYTKDEDVIYLMDEITNKLDLLLVDSKEKEFLSKN